MHALIVAHYFPPDGGAGSQRPASFAQHLPQLGVETTVVCREVAQSDRKRSDPLDESLLARTAAARCVRARTEAGESWTDALLRVAHGEIRARRPDVLLVTMSPFEHVRVALELQKATGVPTVLDLRDPWALDGWFKYGHYFAWRRALSTMRSALATADGVIMNVPGAADAARALEPRHGRTPYGVVTNGWEEEDFPEVPSEGDRAAAGGTAARDEWRIRFAGTFLCSFWRRRSLPRRIRAWFLASGERIDERGRSPLFLLEAIRMLRDAGEPAGIEARVELAGRHEQEIDEIVAASGVAEQVRHLGMLPHDQSTRFISEADALLLPMHGLPHGARARMVPGKLYEYFATGRPILGLAPPGDARDWIARDPRSRIADPCDASSIAQALRELHGEWRRGLHSKGPHPTHSRPDWILEFTRRAQAARLADYLRQVAASRRA